jgi:hypothetical protein
MPPQHRHIQLPLMMKCANHILPTFRADSLGTLKKYQALMAELDMIAPLECSDNKKQKLLLKNIRRTPGFAHLAQHCKDSDLSCDMSAEHLAQNAIIIDQDIAAHASKRIMTVTEDAKEPGWLKKLSHCSCRQQKKPTFLWHANHLTTGPCCASP